VPAFGGYSFGSVENPIFKKLDLSSASSPFMHRRSRPIDYAACIDTCPNTSRVCREEAVWLPHNVLLGDESHVNMIIEAIAKVRAGIGALVNSK
jgi:hypothetical protein